MTDVPIPQTNGVQPVQHSLQPVESLRDAEFASGINQPWFGAVGGYYGGPDRARMWTVDEWKQFPHNRKLPIWVGGEDGPGEGWQAVQSLHFLGVPKGCYTVLDMETRIDKLYVQNFGDVLNWAGYKVWVYGSASSVFENPELNGYWVADYAGIGPFMYNHPSVRATQYTSGAKYDSSTVKDWTFADGTWWK